MMLWTNETEQAVIRTRVSKDGRIECLPTCTDRELCEDDDTEDDPVLRGIAWTMLLVWLALVGVVVGMVVRFWRAH